MNDLYAAPQDLAGGEPVVTLIQGQVGPVSIVGDRLTQDAFITNRVRFTKGRTVDVPTAAKDTSIAGTTRDFNIGAGSIDDTTKLVGRVA